MSAMVEGFTIADVLEVRHLGIAPEDCFAFLAVGLPEGGELDFCCNCGQPASSHPADALPDPDGGDDPAGGATESGASR